MSKWMNFKFRAWLLIALTVLSASAGRAACTYTLSPATRTHGYGMATNTVGLGTSNTCAWAIANTNDWVFILSPASGTGSNTVSYSVAANPNPAWRTGVVEIAGQAFTIAQNPVVCSNSLSPSSRTHGYDFTTGTVNIATAGGCAWTISNSNSWIQILSAASGLGGATVTYTIDDNPGSLWRTGLVSVAGQTYTIIQRSSPCLYELSPGGRVHGHGGTTGLIGIMDSAGCGWTATTTNPWINITSGGSGTGDGSVVYGITANPASTGRTGSVAIADQTFAISQLGAPCSYSIAPASQAHGPGAEGGVVDVTAPIGCVWGVINSHDWINITSGAGGSGGGTVNYAVEANAGFVARTGLVSIAGRNFTITQPGLGCTYKLSPTNRPHGYGAASNSVTLTTSNGCPWEVVNPSAWITITTGLSGAGSNVIGYTVAPNPNSFPRSGVVTVAGQTLTITQGAAPCAWSVAPSTATHGFDSETGMAVVTAVGGCAWNVSNTNAWITMLSPTNGSGDGAVAYMLAANGSASPRSGVLMIADEPFTVTQSGMVCTYGLSPVSRVHGTSATTNSLAVNAGSGCAWSVVNTNTWIAITSATSGAGSGTVNYTVEVNSEIPDRMGVVTIGGQTFHVTQRGVGCDISLSTYNRNHGHGAASNYITVTTSSNCSWTATTTNSWITIVSGMSGTSTGAVGYTVGANPAAYPRTGAVMVADRQLTLTQNAAPCAYSIVPTTETHGAGVETGTVAVTTLGGCAWSVVNGHGWITILSGSNGTGSGVVTYMVMANPDTNARSAVLTIGDDLFTVNQSGLPAACAYRVSPTNRTHGFSATANSVNLFTDGGCPWVVANTNSWITILSETAGTSSAAISYSISANTGPAERIGSVMIGGQPFTITQRVVSCSFSISPSSRPHGYGAATNTVVVSTTAGCSWSVANTNPWIKILSGTEGNGSGTVTYAVEANYGLTPRTGVVLIDGQEFTVTQGGFVCMFNVSPGSRTHGFAAATGTVSVTTTTNCAWSVAITNDWITLLTAGNGMGNGGFTYSVSGNLSPLQRTSIVMVADQALTLVQRAATNGFGFEAIAMQDGGRARLRLVGAPAGVWRLQGSSNLTDWIDISNVTNITGVVEYTDTAAPNLNLRFYRAVQP